MQFQEGYHTYYIYIITNKAKTVLYTGVTNHLKIRLEQHKDNIVSKNKTFASSYNVHFLLYYEKIYMDSRSYFKGKRNKRMEKRKEIRTH